MADISGVIAVKSDQYNAQDLLGKTLTVKLGSIVVAGGQEQPVAIQLDGHEKLWRPGKSMCRVMAKAWGNDTSAWVGHSVTLYCDPKVKFGPLEVGGIRISHMTGIAEQTVFALQAKKGVMKGFTVKPLVVGTSATKADKAADGVRTLIARVNSVDGSNLANVINDPVVVNQRAWLAANRPELAAEVDAAIAAKTGDDPFAGPADTDRGETNTATTTDEETAAAILTAIAEEKTSDALDSMMARRRADTDALPPELQEQVNVAYAARFDVLSNV